MNQYIAFLGLTTLSSSLVLLVLWVSREWFIVRLTKSIEHEYAVKLEKYKYENEKRKKAEMVAKLLAHWIKTPMDQEELNRLTFECFLWLPDDIAKDLSSLLAHENVSTVSSRSVLNKIRKHLNSDSDKATFNGLSDNEIIIFTQENKRKALERLADSLSQ